MESIVRLIIRRRHWVLVLLGLITVGAGSMFRLGVINSSIGGLFLGEHPDFPAYLKRARDFGNDDAIVIGVDDPRFLSPAGQLRLRRASEAVARLRHVQAVRSVLSAQQIRGDEGGIQVRSYAELVAGRPGREQVVLRELRDDPFARGLLVSADGRHTAVVVELDTNADRPAEQLPGLLRQIFAAFVNAGFAREKLHAVGMSANTAAVMEATRFNLVRLFPMVSVVLLVAVWVMFRRLWPVAITGLVALVAVIWTMGFSLVLDRNISVMVAMVPAVILIIAFADVIHLCSAYLLELGHGQTKQRAILRSCSEVGAACVFTSVTTFVGFVSLSLVPTPVSRQLGLVLGFGAAVALLLAVTLTPILLTIFPRPRPWREGATGKVQALLDRFLEWVARLSTGRPRTIVVLFLVFGALLSVGLWRFTIETDFARRVTAEHPLRVDSRYFRSHFAGTNSFHIFLSVPPKQSLLAPQTFARVQRYQEALRRLPDVDRVTSLVDLMQTMHRALHPGARAGPLPTDGKALAQYLLLFEISGGTELDRLVDFSRRTMLLRVHLSSAEFRHTGTVGRQARALAQKHLGGGIEVQATGLAYLLGQFFNVILEDQKRALLLVFVLIAVMMIVGLRSLRAGLWSMVPNLLPLMALGGFAGLFMDYVDSDVLIVAMIAIGIGVDDTIHFLMRFRTESRRQPDVARALQRTFSYSGRGIVITTVILVLGFAPFAASDYLSIAYLGTLLPITLVVALVADLFLVPALASLGAIRF